jgi:hypothetical protein
VDRLRLRSKAPEAKRPDRTGLSNTKNRCMIPQLVSGANKSYVGLVFDLSHSNYCVAVIRMPYMFDLGIFGLCHSHG